MGNLPAVIAAVSVASLAGVLAYRASAADELGLRLDGPGKPIVTGELNTPGSPVQVDVEFIVSHCNVDDPAPQAPTNVGLESTSQALLSESGNPTLAPIPLDRPTSFITSADATNQAITKVRTVSGSEFIIISPSVLYLP